MQLETIIVCGPRTGLHASIILAAMPLIPVAYNHVVVGSNRGTDYQVWDWCMEHEIMCTIDPARWTTGKRKGPPEGPERNKRMHVTWINSLRGVFAMPYGGPGTTGMCEISQQGWTPTYLFDPKTTAWTEI